MNWYKIAQMELPEDFDISELGKCMLAAEIITKQLLEKRITNFYVVEGWVDFGYSEDSDTEHTWIVLNGEIIDPTKEQFRKWGFDPNKIEYVKIKKEYTPQEYLELCKNEPG